MPIRSLGMVSLAGVASALVACSSCGEKTPPPPPPPETKAAATRVEPSHDGGSADAAATTASLTGSPWNVLLLSIDSLRADMPWAGYERPIAPRLSALYAKSTAYTHAYSTSSFTSKSLAGLLTGRYPSELARTGSFFTRYLSPPDFFCTSFGNANVPCVGGHAHAYFGPQQAGFEYGFSDWKLVKGITFDYQTDPYVTSDKLTPLAIEMLGDVSQKGRPFFAWFHYMDPHDEYKTHSESPHFGKRARDLYDEEVFFTDLWIGKLLDHVAAQPWAARTVIVVTADHGEAFGEHGMSRHAHEVWEELVHVPLFFYAPGRSLRTIDEPRGHVDLAPTFAKLLGVELELPGTSLVPELEGTAAAARDVIVDLPEDDYNERRRALVHGSTKIIAFGNDARFSLFDLASDPAEKQDLWRSRADLAAEMKERYKTASQRIHDVAPTGGIPKRDH
jgi:choline-sulfatase